MKMSCSAHNIGQINLIIYENVLGTNCHIRHEPHSQHCQWLNKQKIGQGTHNFGQIVPKFYENVLGINCYILRGESHRQFFQWLKKQKIGLCTQNFGQKIFLKHCHCHCCQLVKIFWINSTQIVLASAPYPFLKPLAHAHNISGQSDPNCEYCSYFSCRSVLDTQQNSTARGGSTSLMMPHSVIIMLQKSQK